MALEPLLRAAARVDPGYSLHGHTVLADGEEYKHLGVPTGTNTFPSGAAAITKMKDHLQKIDDSLLCPWQKFDALRGFIIPQISFHLLHGSVPKSPLIELDKQIKRCAKRWLNVPQRASNEILYLGFDQGGQSLLPLSLLADISTISHAAALLHSKDASVADLSLRSAREVAGLRAKKKVTAAQLADYLSGQTDGIYRTPTTDVNSIWTSARAATRGQSLIPLSLLADIATVSHASSLLHSRDASVADLSYRILREVSAKRAQRRVTNAEVALCLSGETTDVYRTPTVDIPSIWTQARSATRRLTTSFPISWTTVGGSPPLVTLSGSPLSPARVQQTMTKAYRDLQYKSLLAKKDQGHTYRAQHIPHLSNHFVREGSFLRFCDWRFINRARLNLLPLNDIHLPYDNGEGSIEREHETKATKYEPIVQHFVREGYGAEYYSTVVSALGRIPRVTLDALRALRIPGWYTKLLYKLLSADAIKGSRNVYATHVTGQVM
ncbi:hypothetical protein PRIPAC_82287 [Pristionchus pacificus]|uniref:Uncharacterized protein n=1 Tax=Pristionchus pacificus TaxID=54126 RepID=A0A2A6CKT4_PRIPA|nr:hypothetical protein PRIPAC_82287 [Pristionchus pacificus]|eukprot:PDM78824.1 hypothetical protein PRIPAC_31403 [Pristionchus pacificus]